MRVLKVRLRPDHDSRGYFAASAQDTEGVSFYRGQLGSFHDDKHLPHRTSTAVCACQDQSRGQPIPWCSIQHGGLRSLKNFLRRQADSDEKLNSRSDDAVIEAPNAKPRLLHHCSLSAAESRWLSRRGAFHRRARLSGSAAFLSPELHIAVHDAYGGDAERRARFTCLRLIDGVALRRPSLAFRSSVRLMSAGALGYSDARNSVTWRSG